MQFKHQKDTNLHQIHRQSELYLFLAAFVWSLMTNIFGVICAVQRFSGKKPDQKPDFAVCTKRLL